MRTGVCIYSFLPAHLFLLQERRRICEPEPTRRAPAAWSTFRAAMLAASGVFHFKCAVEGPSLKPCVGALEWDLPRVRTVNRCKGLGYTKPRGYPSYPVTPLLVCGGLAPRRILIGGVEDMTCSVAGEGEEGK